MNTLRRHVPLAVLAAVGLTAAVLVPADANAQSDLSADVSTTIEVVADGLNAPRGLVYDQDRHRVLVAEAGVVAQNTGP